MINSKKGFELSINFIVVLILTLVTFGGGLMLARNMFSGADDIRTKLSQQQEKQIEQMMMNNDERVVLPVNKKSIKAGSHTVVGIGVNNMLRTSDSGDASVNNFRINVTISAVQIKDSNCDLSNWNCGAHPKTYVNMLTTDYSIKKNDYRVIEIPVLIPSTAMRGVYVYNVNVSYKDSSENYLDYDVIKKLYVTVE